LNTRCDVNGALAQSGAVHQALLALLMQHPFFKSSWPASTGREHFNLTWLQSILSQFHGLSPEDLMATLVEMAVSAVVRCLDFPDGRLFVCGGGVNNQALMQGLSRRLGAQWSVQATDTVGIAPQAVEAAAFAWLAYCYFTGRDGNSPAVTGASASCVLGVATT
ncbi:MAG: anhydro-N-acetylmuramic acid kinase, partial [Limnobacter sp.]|nr:anhydro-N-acetylmuramic acid kinase [Limnobacter sp.]